MQLFVSLSSMIYLSLTQRHRFKTRFKADCMNFTEALSDTKSYIEE